MRQHSSSLDGECKAFLDVNGNERLVALDPHGAIALTFLDASHHGESVAGSARFEATLRSEPS